MRDRQLNWKPIPRGVVLCALLLGLSVESGEALNTGYQSPSVTGVPHNDWKTPANAYASDNLDASGKDRWALQDYGGFHFDIPEGAVIDGIQVAIEWAGNNNNFCKLGVELSSDGGAGYTLTGSTDTRSTKNDSVTVLGGSQYKWGRSAWLVKDLADDIFRLRLEAIETSSPLDVDQIRVVVYYTIAVPGVNNGGGASDVGVTSATLHGEATNGIPDPTVRLYWGPTDGETNPSTWSNVSSFGICAGAISTNVQGLLANRTYYYRCMASNVAGQVWASPSTNFVTASPSVGFGEALYSIDEGSGNLTLGVELAITSAAPVSIDFRTSDGTAIAGTDFTATNGTLSWAALETGLKTVVIPITDNALDQADHDFRVILTNPVNCVLGGFTTGTVTILDNDGDSVVRFRAVAGQGSESLGSTNIVVTMSPARDAEVTVAYRVVGGTATEGDDFLLAAGTASFAPGVAATGIPITLIGDTLDEPDETLVLSLYAPTGAELGLATQYVFTLLDDDAGRPGVNNADGASRISAVSATLRGAVTNTGGENPQVYVFWGDADGGDNTSAWQYCQSLGLLGVGEFSADVAPPASNMTYYYRCFVTNSGGGAWADFAENFVADDPPTADLIFNPSLESAGAIAADAAGWLRSNTNSIRRLGSLPRTDSYSVEFGTVAGLRLSGADSNALRVSWAGLLADQEVTHPSGGVRPGYVLSGSAYVRASAKGQSEAQFRYQWTNDTDGALWMSGDLNTSSDSYQLVSMKSDAPIPLAHVGDRCFPQLIRATASGTKVTAFNADDLTLTATLPRLGLDTPPGEVPFAPTGVGQYRDLTLRARNMSGGSNETVLYGAYVTDVADLTNAAWPHTAWFMASDPDDVFSIVSGAALVATNNGSYQAVSIRFSPVSAGTYTGIVRIATTDPISHYGGGGMIFNTIVYEEYTLVGVGVEPAVACAPTSLSYSVFRGSLPAIQSFVVTNTGAGVLVYTNELVYDPTAAGWLSVTPIWTNLTGAGATGVHTLAVVSDQLEPGTYRATNWIVGNQTNGTQGVAIVLTVNELPLPTSFSATPNTPNGATRLDLAWAQNPHGHAVMLVRGLDSDFTAPVQGHLYAVGDPIGDDTVIYTGTGTAFTDANLRPRTGYYYQLYTRNADFYSDGVGVTAMTGVPQAQNGNGNGAPVKPAVVRLGDTQLKFGVDCWGTLDGRPGRIRVVIGTNATLSTGLAGLFSPYTNTVYKEAPSPQFSQVGAWFWGIQAQYEGFEDLEFWYDQNVDHLVPMTASPNSSLPVTVAPLPDISAEQAQPHPSSPSNALDLAWAPADEYPVLIVRRIGAHPEPPLPGTHYAVSEPCGQGTVVFKGVGSAFTDTGLSPATDYHYAWFAENNGYYSEGVYLTVETPAGAPLPPPCTIFVFK